MEEAPENGKESSHSVHANGLIEEVKMMYLNYRHASFNEGDTF